MFVWLCSRARFVEFETEQPQPVNLVENHSYAIDFGAVYVC